jgi:hypothetical protein
MLFDISTILTVAILALTWYTVSAIFGRESVGLFAEFSERLGLPVSTTLGDGDPPADGGALDHGGVPNPGGIPDADATLNTKNTGATIKRWVGQ